MSRKKSQSEVTQIRSLRNLLSVLLEHQSYSLRCAQTLTQALESCDRKIRALRKKIRALEKGESR